MKFANFRKSKLNRDQVINNLKSNAKKFNINIGTETKIGETFLIGILNNSWIQDTLKLDKNLVGFIPSYIYVIDLNEGCQVGYANALIMSGVTQNQDVAKLAESINSSIIELVAQSAELVPLKVTNIKLFSTMSCPYCKMEAKWLEEKGVKFIDVHVDLNQQEAERMVQRTGQMGVPVTEVEFDNGEFEYIIGFDKSRLSEVLNVK